MTEKVLESLEAEIRERNLAAEKLDDTILPASITDVIWRSFSTTTESDLRFSDGTVAIRLGYRRATLFGFKNNGVKKAQASFTANYTILVPGYYWHLNPTIRLERGDDSYLVILGGRQVNGRIPSVPAGLLYGTSSIRTSGDEGPLYDAIREFEQFSSSWRFWASSTGLPLGDL